MMRLGKIRKICASTDKVVVLCCGAGEDIGKVLAEIKTACSVITVESDNWNADYSPWPAEGFAGQGNETLQWLTEALKAEIPGRQYYLCGYSLAGLFALWAYYQQVCFAGAACVSGSLWYPGWQDYQKPAREKTGRIYLSLGGKEAKSRNPLMQQVDKAFKQQYEECRQDKMIAAVKFAMNPGGHFSQVEKRLAKGIDWLCESEQEL